MRRNWCDSPADWLRSDSWSDSWCGRHVSSREPDTESDGATVSQTGLRVTGVRDAGDDGSQRSGSRRPRVMVRRRTRSASGVAVSGGDGTSKTATKSDLVLDEKADSSLMAIAVCFQTRVCSDSRPHLTPPPSLSLHPRRPTTRAAQAAASALPPSGGGHSVFARDRTSRPIPAAHLRVIGASPASRSRDSNPCLLSSLPCIPEARTASSLTPPHLHVRQVHRSLIFLPQNLVARRFVLFFAPTNKPRVRSSPDTQNTRPRTLTTCVPPRD